MEKKLLDLTNDDGTLKIGGLIKELIKMKKDIILLSNEVASLEKLIFNNLKDDKEGKK